MKKEQDKIKEMCTKAKGDQYTVRIEMDGKWNNILISCRADRNWNFGQLPKNLIVEYAYIQSSQQAHDFVVSTLYFGRRQVAMSTT